MNKTLIAIAAGLLTLSALPAAALDASQDRGQPRQSQDRNDRNDRDGRGNSNANTNNGNPAKIGARNSGGNQKFIISAEANGRIRLTPSNATAQALDVNAGATANNTVIQQWTWNGSAAQLWTYARADGNWLRFTPDCAPASCMDAVGAGTTSGTSALLWQWAGAVNQQWRFVDTDL